MNAKRQVSVLLVLVLVASMFSESEGFHPLPKVGRERSFIQVSRDAKGALSPYLVSVTLKSQKTSLYYWKHKHNGPVLFAIILVML